jgi:type I restriction enzyme R subunit
MQNQTLQTQAKANSMDTFKYPFDEQFMNVLIERMEQNRHLSEKMLSNEEFGGMVKAWMRNKVYSRMNVEYCRR